MVQITKYLTNNQTGTSLISLRNMLVQHTPRFSHKNLKKNCRITLITSTQTKHNSYSCTISVVIVVCCCNERYMQDVYVPLMTIAPYEYTISIKSLFIVITTTQQQHQRIKRMKRKKSSKEKCVQCVPPFDGRPKRLKSHIEWLLCMSMSISTQWHIYEYAIDYYKRIENSEQIGRANVLS